MFRHGWDRAQVFCTYYNVYGLVAVSLFATFALFCLQLLSNILLHANKNKLLKKINNLKLTMKIKISSNQY